MAIDQRLISPKPQVLTNYWKDKTEPIRETDGDKIESLQGYFKQNGEDQAKLREYQGEKGFIVNTVNDISDYASHRSAFVVTAIAQLLLVNY